MGANFDAKVEAEKIVGMAKQCLDDYGQLRRQPTAAHMDEEVLAKELASIWGDNSKMVAVGAELQKIGGVKWTNLPNVYVHYDQGKQTVPDLQFYDSRLDGICLNRTEIKVVRNGQSIDLTVKPFNNQEQHNRDSPEPLKWSEVLPEASKNK